MLGIGERGEMPESQVGDRRFARGRAYVADRFTHPETAEEKTLKAIEAAEAYAEDEMIIASEPETEEAPAVKEAPAAVSEDKEAEAPENAEENEEEEEEDL